jgi:hypothetical protein
MFFSIKAAAAKQARAKKIIHTLSACGIELNGKRLIISLSVKIGKSNKKYYDFIQTLALVVLFSGCSSHMLICIIV